jgi:hypothetical protein
VFWFWNASIARLGPKFSVCLNLVCGYCRVWSLSNVDLNNWHVDIASVRFIFLVLLLVWLVSIANVNSMHSGLIM